MENVLIYLRKNYRYLQGLSIELDDETLRETLRRVNAISLFNDDYLQQLRKLSKHILENTTYYRTLKDDVLDKTLRIFYEDWTAPACPHGRAVFFFLPKNGLKTKCFNGNERETMC